MRIGINGQKLLIEKPAGPEVYTFNIVNALAKIDKVNEYVIFFDKPLPEGYFERLTLKNPKFTYKVLHPFISWTHFSLALELIINPVDVFFTSVHTMPIIRNKRMKTVGMIHGLEYMANTKKKAFKAGLAAPIRFLAENADFLIVPSEYTKKSLLGTAWRVQEGAISVIPEGVGSNFSKKDAKETQEVLKKYTLENQGYLIAVSTIQPRKNYPALIEAFGEVVKVRPNLKLVVCGKKGWEYEETLSAPQKYGVSGSVLFLGRVSDEDLPYLLSGSTLFVSASLEEGFGLPLLEAMACETYCVVSRIPPFESIGQGNVAYFDPSIVSDISNKMVSSLNSLDLEKRDAKIKAAKLSSLDFSWDKAAEKTLKIFTGQYQPDMV